MQGGEIIKKTFGNNLSFFIPYLVFLVAGLPFLIILPREEILLLLNKIHSGALDFIFFYLTCLGDGITFTIIIIIFLFIRLRLAFAGGLAFIGSGLFSQLVKFISDMPRPASYLPNISDLHIISGIQLYHFHSFPSGHSASIFALCTFLAIIIPSKRFEWLFFAFAFLVALSRVYLIQHFFIDIYIGSLIGVLFAVASHFTFEILKNSPAGSFFESSIIKVIRRHGKNFKQM